MRLLHAVFVLTRACVLALMAGAAVAQGLIDPERNLLIEAVQVRLVNPSTDAALNARLEDLVRRTLAAFPTERYAEERVAAALAPAS